MNLAAFVLGSAAAGAVFGCSEVLWINLKPLLPGEVLRHQLLLPPRNLASFLAASLGTYVSLSLLISVAVGALLRGLATRFDSVASFFLGFFLILSGLTFCASIVWFNMLASGHNFFGLAQLSSYAQIGLGILVALVLPSWLLARSLESLRSAWLSVGVLVPVLLAVGAFAAQRMILYPPVPRVESTPHELPNIVFVTIDTLRADHVGAYSGERVATPVLDQLAAEGVRFQEAISPVPTTTPAHVSIFTSTYPFVHGAKNGVPMRADLPTLPRRLMELGYHTAAFASAYTTKSNVTGLGDSFAFYSDSLNPTLPFLRHDSVEQLFIYRLLDRLAGNQIDAPVVNQRVVDWLDSSPATPFFVWIHYFDPHRPYEAPPEFGALYVPESDSKIDRERAAYKAEVAFVDQQLGAMLDVFRKRRLLDDTIVVVTADHGQAFKEPHPHVDYGHGAYLYDSVLRVPLIFWGPGRIARGRVVTEQVQIIDVAPTLLELLGVESSEVFAGRSLVPVLRGEGSVPSGFAFSQTANLIRPRWFSIRSAEWKLVVNPDDGEEEFFDLRVDPGERVNRVETKAATAARYRERLGATMRLDVEGAGLEQIDAETKERLRALGYLPEE